jgi:phosphatidate cytidylyltransferase
MSNFWARTITGLSMVFILLAGLYFNEWIFATLFFVVSVLGILEFYKIVSSESCHPQKSFGVIAGILLYISITTVHYVYISVDNFELFFLPFFLPIPIFFIPFIIEIYRKKPQPLANIAFTILPVFYIALPLALLNIMNDKETYHFLGFPIFLTGYYILTWSYDTAAYLYGKQFGKHKLFERISPKKTWEGTIAGSVVALLIATGLFFLVKSINLADWYALTFLVLVFGTFGDLVESLIKRNLNIKDSGSILPGHGGILDRFDTIFISAPFVFLYFIIRFPYS